MNGYFQIVNEEMQTSVMLYPAKDGGLELDITEVADYLTFREIEFNLSSLYAAAKELKNEPAKVFLNLKKGLPEEEMLKVRIAADDMSASVRFYAPSNDGKTMDRAEILNDLKSRGVAFGICEDVLDVFLGNREYCKDYEMALGQERTRGEDARVEYLFNTDTKARPTLQEDGSVDFFHLNTINHCESGEVLARLVPAIPSEPGRTVRGEMIPARETKKAYLRFGKNVELSEDGNELRSKVSGHVTLDGDRVSVSDVLSLEAVNSSTGNIEYSGSVQVSGNVCENYSVHAGGNVVVQGVVEGAVIDAAGDVIIARGMNGMGKGRITAGGNVIAKFFENAQVSAGGYVDSDSILHSRINAMDAVHVGGKRGFITGGHICASNGVSVKNLGSNMGADTIVEVGASPDLKEKIQKMENELLENNKLIRQLHPVLSSATERIRGGGKLPENQFDYVKELYILYRVTKKDIKKTGQKLNELQEILENSRHAAVTVSGNAYAGTRIAIGDVSLMIKGNVSYCRFVRERGEVKMKGM